MVDTGSKPTRQPKHQEAASPSPSKRPKAEGRTPSSASRKNKVVPTKPIKSPELKLPGVSDSQTFDNSSVLSMASSTAVLVALAWLFMFRSNWRQMLNPTEALECFANRRL